ncbi:hypothetical protein ACQY0O_000541 [Thecaphora frezii]
MKSIRFAFFIAGSLQLVASIGAVPLDHQAMPHSRPFAKRSDGGNSGGEGRGNTLHRRNPVPPGSEDVLNIFGKMGNLFGHTSADAHLAPHTFPEVTVPKGYELHVDSAGTQYHVDPSGNRLHIHPDGNRVLFDTNGNRLHVDPQGYQYYADSHGNPIYTNANGNPFHTGANGNPFHTGASGNQIHTDAGVGQAGGHSGLYPPVNDHQAPPFSGNGYPNAHSDAFNQLHGENQALMQEMQRLRTGMEHQEKMMGGQRAWAEQLSMEQAKFDQVKVRLEHDLEMLKNKKLSPKARFAIGFLTTSLVLMTVTTIITEHRTKERVERMRNHMMEQDEQMKTFGLNQNQLLAKANFFQPSVVSPNPGLANSVANSAAGYGGVGVV